MGGLSGVQAVAAGQFFSLALLRDGTVRTWGLNDYGQLGDGRSGGPTACGRGAPCSVHPVKVEGLKDVTAIAAGYGQGVALLRNGTVETWGLNSYGQLGNASSVNSAVPTLVKGLSSVRRIAAGSDFDLALKSDGEVMAWGDNSYGQLGNGTTQESSVPVRVVGLGRVTSVIASVSHSLAITESGEVSSWGENTYGELGVLPVPTRGCGSGLPCQTVPTTVSSLRHVTQIAAGSYFSVCLLSDGRVEVWGLGDKGQLANKTLSSSSLPRMVQDVRGVVAIAASGDHALVSVGP